MLAALDGFRGHWVCVVEDEGGIHATRIPLDLSQTAWLLECQYVGIDTPLGLCQEGDREADRGARKLLGRRSSSVFPAPSSAALDSKTYLEALAKSRAASGKGLSKQTFNIFPAVKAANAFRAAHPEPSRVIEAHPEASFRQMGGFDLRAKQTLEGLKERKSLLEQLGPVKHSLPKSAERDLVDALAILWTLRRVRDGHAFSLPSPPEINEQGEEMAIWV